MSTNTENKRPTHAIWQVIGEGDTARWNRIGSAWQNRDGKGLSLVYTSYPVIGRTIVREITDKPKTSASDSDD